MQFSITQPYNNPSEKHCLSCYLNIERQVSIPLKRQGLIPKHFKVITNDLALSHVSSFNCSFVVPPHLHLGSRLLTQEFETVACIPDISNKSHKKVTAGNVVRLRSERGGRVPHSLLTVCVRTHGTAERNISRYY